jgi:hypothetical protein
MNEVANRTHFNLFFNNCSDFARRVLNFYFPDTFNRSIFPDAGVATPKQIAFKLEHYAQRHPEMQLEIFEIPQIPGYRRQSRSNKSLAESLTTTVYAIPIAILNPYVAGGLFADYLVRGRHHLIPRQPQLLVPDNLRALTGPVQEAENPGSTGAQAPRAAASGTTEVNAAAAANSGLKEIKVTHE